MKSKGNHKSSRFSGLRVEAEARLRTCPKDAGPSEDKSVDGQRMLHELQVHQIELEMQNEELRRTRADLETGLERYTELYDCAPLSYLTLAADGTILRANLAAACLLGQNRSRMVGGRLAFFVAPAARAAFNAFLAELVANPRRATLEVDLGTESPELLHARLTATLLVSPHNCEPTILLTIEDLTERQRREEKLEEVIQLLYASQSAARLGTYALDIPTGRWTSSTILDDIFGIDGHFNKTLAGWMSLIHPEDLGDVCVYLGSVLREHIPFDRVYRLIRPSDGQVRWMWTQGKLDCDERGEPSRMLCTVQDITEQELLQESRATADRANRAKDFFLATLSHELRTPLASIMLRAGMLQRDSLSLDKVKLAGKRIEEMAKAQSRLIEDLFDVSRIVAGKLRLVRQPVDLTGLVESAVEVARPSAEGKSVSLRAHLTTQVMPVLGDTSRLQQVMWNLLNNAIKFTPPGGQVAVAIKSAGKYAEVSVSDTGQGIAPEFLSHVFSRFSQADAGVGSPPGGLGLGLAIVQDLVLAHQGVVEADSPGLGRGTTFTVRLPLLDLEPTSVPLAADAGSR